MNPLSLPVCLLCSCITPYLLKEMSHLRETHPEIPILGFAPSLYVYDIHDKQAFPRFQVYDI